jgi:putative transposase
MAAAPGALIPELARQGLQKLIELELAASLGADWHERTEERLGHRNGYRPRTLTTQVGIWSCRSPNCAPAASCPRSLSPAAVSIRPCMR